MTRLELGEVTLRKDWVPLEEIIGSALTRLEKRLEGREVKVEIQNGIPLLLVDPVLIEQLMVNLLENADKYAPREVSIGIAAQDIGDGVAIEVTDQGPGFAPGEEARVFEKFYRGKHIGIAGVGLGLPICKGIAEVHGGTIAASNRATGGAVLRIVIPYGGIPPTVSPLAQGSQ
jgi:two-component system sensor histidine kinase KdpD